MKNLLDCKLIPCLDQLNDTDFGINKICGSTENMCPKEFEVEYQLKKIKDQGNTMMCVGYSHSYNVEILKKTNEALSQYFIYLNRDLNSMEENPFPGYHNSAAEAHLLHDGVISLKDYDHNVEAPQGILDLKEVKEKLLSTCKTYKIKSYFKFNSIDELKLFMSTYKAPAIISIAVYQSVANTKGDGILPRCSGKLVGYHSMCVVGYNEKYLKVINSIGEDWGDHGYGYLDYTDPLLIQEIRGMLVDDINITPNQKVNKYYRVQISANKIREYAENNQKELAKKMLTKEQQRELGLQQNALGSCLIFENGLYKCQVGSFAKKENAQKLLNVLNELGYKDAWITEYVK